MSQSKSESTPITFNVTIADASNLPINHVNALVIRSGVDEFFLTLGVVMPPDQTEVAAAAENGHLVAQPVFRFAISRDTMAKFLAVMAGQYDEQTKLIRHLQGFSIEADSQEVNRDE